MSAKRREITVGTGPAMPEPLPHAVQTAATLYTLERAAGQAAQANLLIIWVASTTYATTTLGVLLIFFGDEHAAKLSDIIDPVVLLLFLPFPACALACYHVILFGIGSIHSGSIDILEKELLSTASAGMRTAYDDNRLAAKAETHWSNFGNARTLVRVSQIFAFLVPIGAAAVLTGVCVVWIGLQYGFVSLWFILPILVYPIALIASAALGIKTVNSLKNG